MPINYSIKPILPTTDGRTENLPLAAVNLAQRLAQLANGQELVTVQVVIAQGVWYLDVDGRKEKLGSA